MEGSGSGRPKKTYGSYGSGSGTPIARVPYSCYLEPTFDQIERGDGGVGDAARQHAAQGAEGVELG
jgi:hypothetical protein